MKLRDKILLIVTLCLCLYTVMGMISKLDFEEGARMAEELVEFLENTLIK